MEIDITHMFKEETWAFAGSVATHGPNVGPSAFAEAKSEADRLFPNVGKEDLVDHFRGYGAWSEEELEDMTLTELRAMLVQDVTLTMRESGLEDDRLEDIDWEEYEALCQAGTYSGRIGPGDDGRVYFWLGE